MMLENFTLTQKQVNGVKINFRHGGKGPPLLLMHGYPQTHFIWHKMADALAEHFTLVMPDLRGYGDSEKPRGTPDHLNYSKRVMAQDMVIHNSIFVVMIAVVVLHIDWQLIILPA